MKKQLKSMGINSESHDSLVLEVPESASTQFPIVGIGASAGGLEALEQFFTSMPANSGMAYVVIQHLDPNHKGIMPELLQRDELIIEWSAHKLLNENGILTGTINIGINVMKS